VKRTAMLVSVCCVTAASRALAFDWSIKTTQSETVELNSNQFLRTSPAASLGSYSTLTANAEARTPTSSFSIDGDGSFRKYWGPGVDGAPSESLTYGFRARYEQREKTRSDREFVEAQWRQSSAAFALLNELGIVSNVSGFLDRLTATGGIDRSITPRDSLSLLATSTRTSYEPSTAGTPFTDTLARGVWRHSLNPITSINLSSELELLDYGNTFNTSIQIYRNQIGIDATLSAVLSFRGNVGVAYIATERGASTSVIAGVPSSTPVSGSVADWIGDAVLTYRMLKNTTLAINAVQSVGPSVVGSLFKLDSISANITQVLNSRSSLTLSTGINRQISTTSTDFASVSASYNYSLTREWLAQLSYRYLHRFASTGASTNIDPLTGTPTVSGTGPADSHSLMVVLTHSYTLLPAGN
jgi:hypothetical protein